MYQILEIAELNPNIALRCFDLLIILVTEQKSTISISENDYNDEHESNSFIFSSNVLNLVAYKLLLYTASIPSIELLRSFYRIVG
jgi:hypothetical protein